jgi:hypothetical protein
MLFFNWGLVRNFGELQILTRASYAMLIIVPMLAGTWPTVRIIINSYNEFLEDSASQLQGVVHDLSTQANIVRVAVQDATPLGYDGEAKSAASTAINNSAERIETLAQTIEKELAKLKQQATLSPFLPPSWALAFFAALAVTFGHMIYQAGVPEIVRQQTLREFVRDAVQEYRANPTTRLLTEALQRINSGRNARFISKLDEYNYKLNKIDDLYIKETMRQNQGNEAPNVREPNVRELEHLERERLNLKDDIIELGARVHYGEVSHLNLNLILPALLFYSVGASIILYIVYQQSLAVLEAAGWLTTSGSR